MVAAVSSRLPVADKSAGHPLGGARAVAQGWVSGSGEGGGPTGETQPIPLRHS